MKVGDLVELSAYGKDMPIVRSAAFEIMYSYGLVSGTNWRGAFHVLWCGHPNSIASRIWAFNRRELKHAKKSLNELEASPSKLGEEALR